MSEWNNNASAGIGLRGLDELTAVTHTHTHTLTHSLIHSINQPTNHCSFKYPRNSIFAKCFLSNFVCIHALHVCQQRNAAVVRLHWSSGLHLSHQSGFQNTNPPSSACTHSKHLYPHASHTHTYTYIHTYIHTHTHTHTLIKHATSFAVQRSESVQAGSPQRYLNILQHMAATSEREERATSGGKSRIILRPVCGCVDV